MREWLLKYHLKDFSCICNKCKSNNVVLTPQRKRVYYKVNTLVDKENDELKSSWAFKYKDVLKLVCKDCNNTEYIGD